jgi:SulP family sulfate permease
MPDPDIKHFILNCSATNAIDASGLESLKNINQRLTDTGVTFHLAEVKGPILDGLKKTPFYQSMKEKIHSTNYDAVKSINPDMALAAKGN